MLGIFGFICNSVLTSKKSEQTEKLTSSPGTIRRRPVASKIVRTGKYRKPRQTGQSINSQAEVAVGTTTEVRKLDLYVTDELLEVQCIQL